MLVLDDLSKRFGEFVALDHVSFTVEPGRMHGFLGRNGAGKSTTMRAVFAIVPPDTGAVRWHGRPVDDEARKRFGYMPEQRGLYPRMRVGDQLRYFGRLHGMSAQESGAATDRWLERLGLAERASDRLERLSHGNQQRVQLAAALVHDPELLVLDEPFSGLDPIGVDTLATVLTERAAAGVPVLFSSHQLDLVETMCETVTIIDHGRIRADGPLADLRARRGSRLAVEVGSADGSWAAEAGLPIADRRDSRVWFELDGSSPSAAQAVLDRAQAEGPVLHFAVEEPSLGDLFRKVIA